MASESGLVWPEADLAVDGKCGLRATQLPPQKALWSGWPSLSSLLGSKERSFCQPLEISIGMHKKEMLDGNPTAL